jgi:hypothetical protein
VVAVIGGRGSRSTARAFGVLPSLGNEGLTWLGLGLLVGLVVQLAAPFPEPPLYDGVVPTEPYVWLAPPPGATGGAQGASVTLAVTGGASPLIALATPELVPQAQVFAVPGALRLGPGTTSISVVIDPVQPQAQPADAHISGNVYRISVTDQAGKPLTALADTQVSVVLRAADAALVEGSVARFADGGWQRLDTPPPGAGGTFVAVVTDFGDFAVLGPGAPTSSNTSAAPGSSGTASATAATTAPPPSIAPVATPGGAAAEDRTPIIVGAGLLILAVAAGAWYLSRRERGPEAWPDDRRDRRGRRRR